MIVWLWIGFLLFVAVMLALDLGVLHRKAHIIKTTEALIWSGFCALLAMLFAVAVYFIYEHNLFGVMSTAPGHAAHGAESGGTGSMVTDGPSTGDSEPGGRSGLHEALAIRSGSDAALKYITGWLIEQSLSLDNIFVIALIFAYFRVPPQFQHRVLFWGIIGALVMRAAMILAGTALIHRFAWITYVFGVLLVLTAVKLLLSSEDQIDPDRNPLVRLARRFYPISSHFDGQRFFTRLNGRQAATPMFLVLLVVESTDVLFAVDSIPAIFAVTTDPFLVFTSNVFAILNLRSLYFALAGIMDKFKYLKTSLVFVLAFVGTKMLLVHAYPEAIPTAVSLAVVGGILAVGMIASVVAARRRPPGGPLAPPSESEGL
jgi:tellurite resistance protein TerC